MTHPRAIGRWWALGALCFAELMVMIDNTIVNVALPVMSRELGADITGLQWIADAYTLFFAGLLLTGGYLGDRFGRRRALVVGTVGFGVVSALAASATTLHELIAARAGLGVFAALVFPATLALITTIFTVPRERAVAVGMWAATSGAAIAIGPVLGGWLLTHFSWSSVFWVNLPTTIVGVVLVAALVPETGRVSVAVFDWRGVVTSIIAVGVLTYTIIQGPHVGWTHARTLVGMVVAVIALVVFVFHELRASAPIFDLTLFRNPRFAVAAAMIALAFFALLGFIFLITQYFQAIKGYSPLGAGVRTLPFAIVMAMLSPVAMWAAKRYSPGQVAAFGTTMMSAGFLLVEFADAQSSYWGMVVIAMSLMAAGLAFISGPCTDLIMSSLTLEQAGAGSAVNDTTREIGCTLGVAVLGSVLASIYTPRVSEGLAGLPLPGYAKDAIGDSAMAGYEVAQRVPDPIRTKILSVVTDGFIDGLHQAAWVAAAATLVSAPIAWWVLRPRSGRVQGATPRAMSPSNDS